MKFEEILQDLKEMQVLGKVLAYMYHHHKHVGGFLDFQFMGGNMQ
ncbi:hypothetical protein Lalb_Chr03g0038111 [Lupinus albus]|uniref:Uncharacterized protein n=1 Tax=Lupinus albus TaxID=3870 RepID=A0A6A4QV20_LUPAL|nr:hypothetical protein Lalb_Chr03g0038111 [Lupinus albus]